MKTEKEIANRIESRFWALVEKDDADRNKCYGWKGKLINGYPYFSYGCRQLNARLYIFRRHYKIKKLAGNLINVCGNKACCNPLHLAYGKIKKRKPVTKFKRMANANPIPFLKEAGNNGHMDRDCKYLESKCFGETRLFYCRNKRIIRRGNEIEEDSRLLKGCCGFFCVTKSKK